MKSNVKTQSGNRIRVMLDGIQVGLIQSVRGSDDYAPEAASGIGDIHAQEHVPTMARHVLNVNAMVLKADNLRQKGIFAANGDAVLKGLVFDFEVFDKDSNQLLRKYVGCSYASGDTEINKHAILMHSGVFNCLDVTGTGI